MVDSHKGLTDPSEMQDHQLRRLREGIDELLKTNRFYRDKLAEAGVASGEDVDSPERYRVLPFTTKAELSNDQVAHPPYGSNVTYPDEAYIRMHQTSGTTGASLFWLDTAESWDWWGRCWQNVYAGAGVTAADRIYFGFSFGPFIGFWSAHEGARQLGAMAISGGAASTEQRLQAILAHRATVVVCTPTYGLYLAEVAESLGIDLAGSDVRTTIHAGEPGAGIPATRKRLEEVWGARCFDHPGATEVGAWGFECPEQSGVHLNEGEFIFEVVDPDTGREADEGELVVTNLGRWGMPVIRYRTGDGVRLSSSPCPCGSPYRRLDGGVTGRLDDAMIVRGVNVYPSAVENVIREFDAVGEFAVEVNRRNSMDEMAVRVEVEKGDPERVAREVADAIRRSLSLRVSVRPEKPGTLPRFELKARRFEDRRGG